MTLIVLKAPLNSHQLTYHIKIRDKMLEFFLVMEPTLSPYSNREQKKVEYWGFPFRCSSSKFLEHVWVSPYSPQLRLCMVLSALGDISTLWMFSGFDTNILFTYAVCKIFQFVSALWQTGYSVSCNDICEYWCVKWISLCMFDGCMTLDNQLSL